ncbi:carbamoyl-phosphate synthase large subunit [Desulfatitalea alkaliphila]|uniref:Carbamoyl phosphate synthase large chain n=1 Tax=Desulfatitalea alkaliphila TaxID=2929485 RepID=A0AA41R420_9BACT|nr:carbamoyl-phosphate synthase large subunit [Desulfatitalea alkaliphila]MCJ8502639.1 carbamoyl-phosphate synthase large subunit [Desulfatitalea alkaliphila]
MPKRTDIQKILIIGAGPIVIGQACEFDYSGTQACKALKSEGYEVVLVNSNPATIMTDPEMAHRTYIEPVTADTVAAIIAKERPDVLLPTLGGQTGLNTAVELHRMGVLEAHGVELIGANLEAIRKAEDRDLFRRAMTDIGLTMAPSDIATDMENARAAADRIGYPVIIRPAFTLGGTGGGVAYNPEDLETIAAAGLQASLIGQIQVEASVLGWKEFELEVMRDGKDNVVIVCSIENVDPMGVHTGDSITVAPAQTLSDREYQQMRNAAIAIMREIGVDTGGSNVQFAVNPRDGRMLVVEMNPRVSRSSALASKATGFPIAKIAALLAVGYTLDELPNDITGRTVASFEPALDYCVVKMPRFAFEKFPECEDNLTTSMQSVGEAMAIGRTFKEALQKAIRSLETGRPPIMDNPPSETLIARKLAQPNSQRIFYLRHALSVGWSEQRLFELTGIDPWFLNQMGHLAHLERELASARGPLPAALLRKAKAWGFSDEQIARLTGVTEAVVGKHRRGLEIFTAYKQVDTCAAEFEAATPYYYSTYETECEARAVNGAKVMIIGGGPNRIGQGIEFDYCCVHAAFALAEEGVQSIMVNSNPETVSTDYDTSDRLYFEPLTSEDVLHIVETEKPMGLIVQFGGQTPLNLALPLHRAGVTILGTHPQDIARAEDRSFFRAMLQQLGLHQPASEAVLTVREAAAAAAAIGFPVLVRPSYVLGGRAMKIVFDPSELETIVRLALEASPGHPVLIDKFLENAVEVDVDAVSDGANTCIAGLMEHIEAAGIHSGDSACVLPPRTLGGKVIEEIRAATRAMAAELRVVGLMNVQYAVHNDKLFVLEVNPRASRTVPFVSKATGVALAKVAAKAMLGRSLTEMGIDGDLPLPRHVSVKESVFPFVKLSGVDLLLGPEMKSTGEVMGIASDFGAAYAKAQLGAGQRLPTSGAVFISVEDKDKPSAVAIAVGFRSLGFDILSTEGTARFLAQHGVQCRTIKKVSMGRPHVVDAIKNKIIQLVVNTAGASGPLKDGYAIRRAALAFNVPYTTTIHGAEASLMAISSMKREAIGVLSIQDHYSRKNGREGVDGVRG